MIELLATNAHPTLSWGTPAYIRKQLDEFDLAHPEHASSRPSCLPLVFSVEVSYVDSEKGKVSECGFFTVYAHRIADESTFEQFHSVLAETEMMCTRPILRKKWDDCVKEAYFREAEQRVLSTPSFEEQFTNKANLIETETARLILFRGSLWKLKGDIPIEPCDMFLQEYYRREIAGLDRLDPDEYFADLAQAEQSREPIPEVVRHEVWRRDKGRCVKCGSQERLEFDHIIPVSKGGSSTARNLQLLCEPCNRKKAASA